MTWKTLWVVLERVAIVATIVASATVVWAMVGRGSMANTVTTNALNGEEISGVLSASMATRPSTRGKANARWAVAEFSDYQCPYCARHATEVLPSIDNDFVNAGKLKYLFLNLPIERIHPHAKAAAQAAECAGIQNHYWEMHDHLFQNQKLLAQRLFRQYGEGIGLNIDRFGQCIDNTADARIASDAALGATFGINSTPSFLIGEVQRDGSIKLRRRLMGLRPYSEWKSILEELVN